MDKVDVAVERMKMASDISLSYYQKPIMITYSGGKDSDACVEVAKIAKIPFEVVNSHTSADAPQTVRHIRKKFHELELAGIPCRIEFPTYKGERTSMWSLIPQKKMPPTRLMRYCCEVLKETSGDGRAIVTGVRWDESVSRKNKRGVKEALAPKEKDRIILTNDNDDDRRLIEQCQLRSKTSFNIIVDWKDADVWDFLHSQKTETNILYQCGYDRVGCIGCPLASKKRRKEFADFPAYRKMYIHAFDRMLLEREKAGKKSNWQTGYDVFRWWMEEDPNQLQFGFMTDEE